MFPFVHYFLPLFSFQGVSCVCTFLKAHLLMSLFLFYIFVCKKAVDLIDRFRFYYVLRLFYRYRSFVCRLCRVSYFSHMVRVADDQWGEAVLFELLDHRCIGS